MERLVSLTHNSDLSSGKLYPTLKQMGCCFTEDALDFSSVTADYTKLFYSKIRIVIIYFYSKKTYFGLSNLLVY